MPTQSSGWRRGLAVYRSAGAERLTRISMNLIGAAGAAFFAEATLRGYLQTHRPLGAAYCAEQMWVVAAYLIRRPARTASRRWGDWALAFGGTFGGVLFRPVGAHPQWGITTGLVLQLIGLTICVASFLTLGRSFGFVAADRGLVDEARTPWSAIRFTPPTFCCSSGTCCRASRCGMPS